MKQERIFEALSGIGDDLLTMAQERRFPNAWRRWGRTAACIALVLCLTAIALPYFPIGCGSSTEAPASTEEPAAQAPAEMEGAVKEEAKTEEAAPQEEPKKEEAMADTTQENEENTSEVVSVWFREVRYELQSGVVEQPRDLGEQLGEVHASDGRDLTGCRVFAVLESEDLYVETPEGWMLAIRAEYQ